MGTWYSVPLVIVGMVSMLGSAMVLAFSGLPYSPLSQVLNQENPYSDPRLFVTGQITLQGEDPQELQGSTVLISNLSGEDPIALSTSSDGTFAVSLEPGIYVLVATRTGWTSETIGFAVIEEDVVLEPIELLPDTVVGCPGSLPGEEGAPSILSVTANPSPTNSLIQNFDVLLSAPGEVWVEYFPKADPGEVLSTWPTPNLDDSQQFQVMRLVAETEYCYQVYARAGSGTGPVSASFPGEFATAPLPAGLAGASFNKTIGTQSYDLTLLDFNDEDFSGLVALNEDAQLVWYYENTDPVFAATQKEDLNVVFGQLNGQNHVEIKPDGTTVRRVTDVLEDGTPCEPTGRWHHESLIQPDDKVLFLGSEIQEVSIDGEDRQQTGDVIMEWDQEQGTVTPLVSLFQLLDAATLRTNASNTTGGFFWRGCDGEAPSQDWTHANSIWVAEDGTYVVSIRHLNQVVAIAPDLQSVIWQLGGPDSDFSFPDPNDQFYHQHTAKLLPNGNVLLFDNGNARPEEEGGQFSRALELELDMGSMEARKVWEYRHSPDRYAGCCSSVERLENGNSVLVFGNDADAVFTLVEADAEGEAVSAIEISSPGKGIQYRAYALDSINGESKK